SRVLRGAPGCACDNPNSGTFRGGHMSGRSPGRNSRAAAIGVAAALAVTGAAPALAATPASPSWRIVKRVPSGPLGDFTAVVAVGRTGGWAFNGGLQPTACKPS